MSIFDPMIRKTSSMQTFFRLLLGGFLLLAGTGHLTWARTEFLAQVPDWLPIDQGLVVILSGIVEILLGLSLVFLARWRVLVGWVVATFFVLVFPGNIAQYLNHTDGFGLDTDLARGLRLLFQPVLIVWALWSTGAWQTWRRKA